MIEASQAVVWCNDETKSVVVKLWGQRDPDNDVGHIGWCDPIGAAYRRWQEKMTDTQRAQLMVETAVDLAMAGYDLGMVLREFAKVDCFFNLGRESYPMCRALTKALVGRSFEANTMSFDELVRRK